MFLFPQLCIAKLIGYKQTVRLAYSTSYEPKYTPERREVDLTDYVARPPIDNGSFVRSSTSEYTELQHSFPPSHPSLCSAACSSSDHGDPGVLTVEV